MATPRQKVQVGIFLTVCSLLLLGILLTLAGLRREHTVPYVMEFDENVSGLASGAEVRYRGVPVGRVTEIIVTPSYRVRVRVEIRPSVMRPRPGTTAQLGTVGITGQLYVNLVGGDVDAPPLAPGATLPTIPSLLTNLATELPSILASIKAILERLEHTLGEQGQVTTIARALEQLVLTFNTAVGDIETHTVALLGRLEALTEHDLRPLLRELTTTAQTTRHVFTRTEVSMRQALTSSTQTLQHLTLLIEHVERTNEELQLTLQSVRGDAFQVEFHIRQAVRIWRETLASARQFLDYVEQDPAALLLGKPSPLRDRRPDR